MSCSQKSIVVSIITALTVAAAFFAVYAVTQADVLACEHDSVIVDDDEVSSLQTDAGEESKRSKRGRGEISRRFR